MTAPTLTYSWDGCLQTPCPSWCDSSICDGTAHVSAFTVIDVRRGNGKLSLCVEQSTNEVMSYISIEDYHGRRRDEFTADEAERLANALLDHAKILRAHAREAGR